MENISEHGSINDARNSGIELNWIELVPIKS